MTSAKKPRKQNAEPLRFLAQTGADFWNSVDTSQFNRAELEALQVLCEQIDERVALRLAVLRTGQPADRTALRTLDQQIGEAINRYITSTTHSGTESNRQALEKTLKTMKDLGHIENIDSARIAALRNLADAVDSDPTNASLWREYRIAESTFRENTAHDQDDFQDLLAALSAEVRDTTPD